MNILDLALELLVHTKNKIVEVVVAPPRLVDRVTSKDYITD